MSNHSRLVKIVSHVCVNVHNYNVKQCEIFDLELVLIVNVFHHQMYKKSLVRMFEANDEDVVFMETCKNLKSYPHLVIECIPVPREIGEVAPICFQKAINECGPEWSNNKKLVTIRGGVKRSVSVLILWRRFIWNSDQ